MKIKSMNRIEIKIIDHKDFADVAFLVDKSHFLEAIEQLRQKWKVKQLLPLDKFKDWQQTLYDKGFKEVDETEVDIRDLRIRFNRPENFDEVIVYAVVCGIIPDGIYHSTYWAVDPLVEPPSRLQSKTMRVVIYVTPQSQGKDITSAFREIKKNVFQKRNDGYDPFFSLYNIDTAGEVERDRNWYWRNEQGESHQDIAVKDMKIKDSFIKAQNAEKHIKNYSDEEVKKYLACLKYVDAYVEKVRKAIERYKKALSDA